MAVTQNGSGDHQTVRIIGPQRPKVDGTFAATKHPNGVSYSTAAVYDSPTASSDKVNGVKEKQTTSIASLKGKNITKVGVPSLVPAYMEPGDSDEDCSPTLQVSYLIFIVLVPFIILALYLRCGLKCTICAIQE